MDPGGCPCLALRQIRTWPQGVGGGGPSAQSCRGAAWAETSSLSPAAGAVQEEQHGHRLRLSHAGSGAGPGEDQGQHQVGEGEQGGGELVVHTEQQIAPRLQPPAGSCPQHLSQWLPHRRTPFPYPEAPHPPSGTESQPMFSPLPMARWFKHLLAPAPRANCARPSLAWLLPPRALGLISGKPSSRARAAKPPVDSGRPWGAACALRLPVKTRSLGLHRRQICIFFFLRENIDKGFLDELPDP